MVFKAFLKPSIVRMVIIAHLMSIIAPISFAQQKKQQRINIAVLDFEARGGVSKEDAASLSDAFQGQIIETGQFVVVDRSRIKAILTEQGFQQSEACSQVECIAEVGKILKVEKMFAGTIGKIGRIFTVNIQLVDVSTAQILQNKSRRHDGEIEELLTDIIPQIAAEMASELTGKDIQAEGRSGGGWLWYVVPVVLIGGGAGAYLLTQKKSSTSTNGGNNGNTPTSLPGSPDFP